MVVESVGAGSRSSVFEGWLARASKMLSGQPVLYHRKQKLSEEAIAEALAKAWEVEAKCPGYFFTYRHLLNWLMRTAWWKAIDHFRQRQRQLGQVLPAGPGDRFPDHPCSLREQLQQWTSRDKQKL